MALSLHALAYKLCNIFPVNFVLDIDFQMLYYDSMCLQNPASDNCVNLIILFLENIYPLYTPWIGFSLHWYTER